MAFSRQLAVVGILGACFFVAVGCGDDDGKKTNDGDAGEGGESSGGKSQGGSTSTTAGKGGTGTAGSGTAGSGTAGSSTAGSAGSATQGGEAGSGGAGTGGSDGNMAGEGESAGGGGDAGGGGEGGAPGPTASSCGNQCETDDDCVVPDSFYPSVCDPVTDRCIDALAACTDHDSCVPWMNAWYTSCTEQADCDEMGGLCVAYGGKGYCAQPPSEGLCFPFGAPEDLPEFGDPDPQLVSVCLSTDGRCHAGQCLVGCAAFGEGSCEGLGNGDSCNAATGLCECAGGDECASEVCGADAQCVECVTDLHCAANEDGHDTCVAGSCGCTDATSCPDETESATPVCE